MQRSFPLRQTILWVDFVYSRRFHTNSPTRFPTAARPTEVAPNGVEAVWEPSTERHRFLCHESDNWLRLTVKRPSIFLCAHSCLNATLQKTVHRDARITTVWGWTEKRTVIQLLLYAGKKEDSLKRKASSIASPFSCCFYLSFSDYSINLNCVFWVLRWTSG